MLAAAMITAGKDNAITLTCLYPVGPKLNIGTSTRWRHGHKSLVSTTEANGPSVKSRPSGSPEEGLRRGSAEHQLEFRWHEAPERTRRRRWTHDANRRRLILGNLVLKEVVEGDVPS